MNIVLFIFGLIALAIVVFLWWLFKPETVNGEKMSWWEYSRRGIQADPLLSRLHYETYGRIPDHMAASPTWQQFREKQGMIDITPRAGRRPPVIRQ